MSMYSRSVRRAESPGISQVTLLEESDQAKMNHIYIYVPVFMKQEDKKLKDKADRN